jgi:hypothetical protein
MLCCVLRIGFWSFVMSKLATVVDESFIRSTDKYRVVPKGDVDIVELCSDSVILFSERMLGVRLFAWQVEFLRHIEDSVNGKSDDKEFVAITSRQIGKSVAIAIFSLWAAVFNKYPHGVFNNTPIGVVSAGERQAQSLLNKIKLFIRNGDAFMADTYLDADGQPLFGKSFLSGLIDPKASNNAQTISFVRHDVTVHGEFLLAGSKSGTVICSYPPTGVVLGETFSIVVVDEAGRSEKITDQFFYNDLYPTGNKANAIRIYTSTPWAPSGFFYRMIDPNNEFAAHSSKKVVFTVDAIAIEDPEYYKTVMQTVESMNADGKVDEVQRSYYCRFVKGENNYFVPEKVRACFSDEYSYVESYSGLCDMGVDFGGQVKSRTVVTICTLDEAGEVVRIYDRVYGVQKDDDLLPDIAELKERFNVQRIIVDECPAGDHLIRKMELSGWDIVRMNFKSEKVKKYGNFRAYVNKGKIHSYPDNDLLTEMLALENAAKTKQSYIQAPHGYSDDRIDSFVLASYHYVVEESGKLKFFNWSGEFSRE